VINAGVEGYSTDEVEKQIDRFLSYQPDVVTLYIGWNAIFSDEVGLRPEAAPSIFATVRILERAFLMLTKRGEFADARALYLRAATFDANNEDAQAARRYRLTRFQGIVRLVDRIRAAGGTPVLVTLPGLLSPDKPPSPAAAKIAHLPSFTDNAYVVARMTGNYNEQLRDLGRRSGIPVFDFEKWATVAFPDPENWFFDSVHLKAEGQVHVGRHMAESLIPILQARGIEPAAHPAALTRPIHQ